MGSAVSTLSETEGGVIAKYLRTNLERYEASEYSEDEIRIKLTADFDSIRKEVMAAKPPVVIQSPEISRPNPIPKAAATSSTTTSTRSLGKPLGNPKARSGASGKGPVMVRRRSFGNISDINSPKRTPEKKINVEVVVVPQEPAPITVSEMEEQPQQQIDSWDSVTDQPFCNICAMAFKTKSAYERHVKYSDLHINNAKKIENEAEAEAKSAADALAKSLVDPEVDLAEKRSKQVEGEDYRLLYSGSKFFWQSQETIDIQIYHHINSKSLEVVGYDLQRNKELQRVYLGYPIIMDIVLPTVIQQVDAERQTKKEQNRFATLGDRDVMIEDATRHAFITYILNHLKYTVTKDGPEVTSNIFLGLSDTELETIKENPTLKTVPQELVPIYVAHRRRTSTEEITAAMNNLDDDRNALKQALNRAEKISDLLNKAAAMFSGNKYSGLSKYKMMWQKSIQKVMFIKTLQKVKARLQELGLN